jgi:hypothetical protein
MSHPPAPTFSGTALGCLEDGTPYFAPFGELPYDRDEDRVQCHLCGEWFRTVGNADLRLGHGWTIGEYRDTFQLLRQTPTRAAGVSDRLRVLALARLAAGELTRDSGYRKPTGARGCGVERSRSLAALRPEERRTSRFRGRGCPACGRRRTSTAVGRHNARVPAERSLAVRRPALAAELDPTLNVACDAETPPLTPTASSGGYARDTGASGKPRHMPGAGWAVAQHAIADGGDEQTCNGRAPPATRSRDHP